MAIPPDSVAMGVPAKVRRQLTDAERERVASGPEHYVRLAQEYKEESI
jgi:carbonic anhydrase/acetyltransferase-like protein (isoleucine patch superfamily)